MGQVMNVEGCTALITGANQGLGRALAGMPAAACSDVDVLINYAGVMLRQSLTDTDAPSLPKPDDSSAAGPRFTHNRFPFSTPPLLN
jgi:hypothetical protein